MLRNIYFIFLLLVIGELCCGDTCALLFFGIGRKFEDIVLPSIRTNILEANPTCDIFVHTYNITKAPGGRIGEDGSGIINVSEILLLGDKSQIMLETEEDFKRQRDVEYYRTVFPRPSRWIYPSSIDNMIRQWHSIEKVWSKMEAHEEKRQERFDLVGLFRLDVLYTHPIFLGDASGVAIIPLLMYKPSRTKHSWGGYNDRSFYGKREYASPWATERFNSVPLYLQWQKSNDQYDEKNGLHSEDFLRWMLVFQFPTPLAMKPICFMRVRSSGMIMRDDCAPNMNNNYHQNLKMSEFNSGSLQQTIPGAELRPDHPETYQICAVVRTHIGQANILPITLLSLTQQSNQGGLALSLFVVNTDSEDYLESKFMHIAAADANMKAGYNAVTVLDAAFHHEPPRKGAYGYDVTDHVLELLLDEKQNCTHFLFTNGDNFYVRSFLDWIGPSVVDGKQLIAWDFLTHHKRKFNVIKVQFIRKQVDLGSVLVDRRAIQMKSPHMKFLPHGDDTRHLFARDYFFFREIYDYVGESNVSIIHQVLFAHQ